MPIIVNVAVRTTDRPQPFLKLGLIVGLIVVIVVSGVVVEK